MNSAITKSFSSSLPHLIRPAYATVCASPLRLHQWRVPSFLLPTVQSRNASFGKAQPMRRSAGPSQDPLAQNLQRIQTTSREAFEDEFGLLPATFVRPKWSNLPSVFSDPSGWFRIVSQSVRSGVVDLAMIVNYYKTGGKKKPITFRHRKSAALELHARMNKALAAGDTATLEKICCSGLLGQATSIIARRRPGKPAPEWHLEQYIKFPRNLDFGGARVLSDRAAMISRHPEIGFRQVVVRIQSRQTVTKPPSQLRTQMSASQRAGNRTPAVATGEKKSRDCTEHVVLQKLIFKGVEDKNWKIWGLVEETSLEKLLSDPLFDSKLSLDETLRAVNGNRS